MTALFVRNCAHRLDASTGQGVPEKPEKIVQPGPDSGERPMIRIHAQLAETKSRSAQSRPALGCKTEMELVGMKQAVRHQPDCCVRSSRTGHADQPECLRCGFPDLQVKSTIRGIRIIMATGILGMITDGYIRQRILDAYAEVIIEDAI